MTTHNGDNGKNGKAITRTDEMKRLIDSKDWDALDKLVGYSHEEDERILREEPKIDGAEFNRLMEELDRLDDERAVQS